MSELHSEAATEHGHRLEHEPVPVGVDTGECPVMPGRFVSKAKAEEKGWVRQYAGRTYWLCCAGCAPKFDADPAAFAAA
jgi:YHS domain-containing protein